MNRVFTGFVADEDSDKLKKTIKNFSWQKDIINVTLHRIRGLEASFREVIYFTKEKGKILIQINKCFM